MPLPRIVTLIVGLVVILGLMLWLVENLSRLYGIVSWSSPLLGNLLLLLLIVLIGALIAAFVYYVVLFQGTPKRSRQQQGRQVQIPEAKTEAAAGKKDEIFHNIWLGHFRVLAKSIFKYRLLIL